jgi:D-beta-D-heptose 7-phosphate kinase/D-beta-D-heptose 1-phosphate adenosyltransferase
MKKYLIIGERCQDRFVYGKSNRLSPEAPIPIFSPISEVKTLGMAMNVYNNLKAMISSGTDKVSYVVSKAASVKTRFVDDKTNHYFLRVDSEEKYDRIQFS